MIKVVTTKNELRRFARLPFTLYAGDSNWVPPLQGVQERNFMPRTNPAMDDVTGELYLAYADSANSDGKASAVGNRQTTATNSDTVQGRVAVVVNKRYNAFQKEKTAFFGFFECIDSPAIAAELLAAVRNYAMTQGMERIIGPVDFSTNYACGTLVTGNHLPPTVGTPYTKAYYPSLLAANGYHKAMDFFAYTYHRDHGVPERLTRLRPVIEKRNPGLTVRSLRQKNISQDMAALREVYDDAFAGNWGFVPMSEREFSGMQRGFLNLHCLESVYLAAVNGQPAGILIAIPDIYQATVNRPGKIDRLRLSVLGVKPAYRSRGIETILILHLLAYVARYGYREIDCSLILENNVPMNTFIGKEFGCPLTRTFRVFEQLLH